jgi:hypothetical protein
MWVHETVAVQLKPFGLHLKSGRTDVENSSRRTVGSACNSFATPAVAPNRLASQSRARAGSGGHLQGSGRPGASRSGRCLRGGLSCRDVGCSR